MYYISLSFNFLLLRAQPCYKIRVIIELSDSLKDVKIAKNDWKRLYNVDV